MPRSKVELFAATRQGDDELIVRNPCWIKAAGTEPTPERPVIGLAGVMALAEAMPGRYRVLVLLAVFASLRWAS